LKEIEVQLNSLKPKIAHLKEQEKEFAKEHQSLKEERDKLSRSINEVEGKKKQLGMLCVFLFVYVCVCVCVCFCCVVFSIIERGER